MEAYNDFQKWFDEAPFRDRLATVKQINDMYDGGVSYAAKRLTYDGYLEREKDFSFCAGDGEHYVYVWRHAWGDPFYVGTGKGDRWTNIHNRCAEFYPHIDKADAVVYLLLTGVDSKTARMFEKYVSVNLVEAGYTLANGDNNPRRSVGDAKKRLIESCSKIDSHPLAPKVQKAVVSILNHNVRCDYRVTCRFITENGADYFSRTHAQTVAEEAI